jgi:hypothetical protein
LTPPKLISAVLCDDIRQEITGKSILIGAYANELNISSLPAVIPLAIFLAIEPKEQGLVRGKLRVLDPFKMPIFNVQFDLTIANTAPHPMAMGPFPLNLGSSGKYCIQWCFDEKKWSEISFLKVNHVPGLSVFGSAAPSPPQAP